MKREAPEFGYTITAPQKGTQGGSGVVDSLPSFSKECANRFINFFGLEGAVLNRIADAQYIVDEEGTVWDIKSGKEVRTISYSWLSN